MLPKKPETPDDLTHYMQAASRYRAALCEVQRCCAFDSEYSNISSTMAREVAWQIANDALTNSGADRSMLPRELPISDEGIKAAVAAVERGGPWDSFTDEVRFGIEAFLQAEGFEVETRGIEPESGAVLDGWDDEPGEQQARLVSPWKPAPSSTGGGEGVTIHDDLPRGRYIFDALLGHTGLTGENEPAVWCLDCEQPGKPIYSSDLAEGTLWCHVCGKSLLEQDTKSAPTSDRGDE
jgi:hypothetical protein